MSVQWVWEKPVTAMVDSPPHPFFSLRTSQFRKPENLALQHGLGQIGLVRSLPMNFFATCGEVIQVFVQYLLGCGQSPRWASGKSFSPFSPQGKGVGGEGHRR